MALELYFHPFASYCQKVLVALYENEIPFEPHFVDLGDETSAANFKRIWPIGKFPVIRDNGRVIPEATIIIEYLSLKYRTALLPPDPERALETRLWDRFFDLYVQEPMQKIVIDRLRPEGRKDGRGVELAKAQLQTSYRILEERMDGKTWAAGDAFDMADCAAAPALFYANLVVPIDDAHPRTGAYLSRLMKRPSFARVVEEARPYASIFPK